jgi:hypothetical protein
MASGDQPPNRPADPREAALAKALRANLRRRKAGALKPSEGGGDASGPKEP